MSCSPEPAQGGPRNVESNTAKSVTQVPAIPPLALTPRLGDFEAKAAMATAQVPADKQKELVEYFELAESEGVSGRTQHRARSSFDESEFATRVLEWITTEHEDARLRSIAAFRLGERKSLGATTVLLKRLKYEKDAFARIEVAAALIEFGVEWGFEELRLALENPNHVARSRAGGIAVPLAKRFGAELGEQPTWQQLTEFASTRLAHWRETGVPTEVPKPPEDSEKTDAPSTVTTDDPKSELALRDARFAQLFVNLEGFQLRPVDDARFMLRRAGKLGFEDLRLALAADEHYLRNHALEVVYGLGPVAHEMRELVRPLLADPLSRAMACRTLGAIEDREALPWCVDLLEHGDLETRVAAAQAIGSIGGAPARSMLEKLATDEAQAMDLRVAAAGSLARLELDRPWWNWLVLQRKNETYHKDTLDEMLDEIDRELDRKRRR
ncbi:MAG: HEAT repeat domain-containing protein [Planctomycetes bacterium]|nr:HEAT repeat domain-containing protein [Planctomycetota bacterium]